MSKSESIRQMARAGMATAQIARELGIRYQFAYKVLKSEGLVAAATAPRASKSIAVIKADKPPLPVATIERAGFVHSATWINNELQSIILDRALPKEAGVYAFAVDGRVMYVGLASMGLAKRIYFYARPGVTQRTSLRLNQTLSEHATAGKVVEVYTAMPSDADWNGLPVDGNAGLELGLIRTF